MADYDEEQKGLEEKVKELQAQLEKDQMEIASGERFVRMVKKYQDFSEITPTMLNEFIEKIVIHEATGGRGINRSQQIDIYFNFIGQYYPPVNHANTPEQIALLEAERLAKKKAAQKRSSDHRQAKMKAMRKAAQAGDPEAMKWYEKFRAKERAKMQRFREKKRLEKTKEAVS